LILLASACRGKVERLDACLPDQKPVLSLLAVGDTGDRPEFTPWLDQHIEVGRVMAEEQRSRPAAALLLLGDNFYSEGLEANESAQRVSDNVVKPFCAFVATDAKRYAEVSEGCTLAPADRTPVPIYAVLGNHDYNTDESPRLQRELVPEFVSNWDMPRELAAVRELGHGVSLIVTDSEALDRGADPAPLKEALLAAKGPWRILVGHLPVTANDANFKRALATAMEATGVPVQILLAGHDHNLQISEPGPPFPALVVIAGSGSRLREARYGVQGTKFIHVRPGFARIDLDGEGSEQRLVVSLIETPKHHIDFWSPTRVVGCWSVDVAGQVSGGSRIH
jgi:predicted phosphodiesterase